jgi:formylglycine-generating enzyme required for sulfatase activity/class 3 adenylate cyclase
MSDEGAESARRGVTAPRRLATIMVADIVGYSRLTQADERGTHERVLQIKRELIEPVISEHGGRLVRQRGDGFLCVFDSPVECVRAAIVIQQNMVARNLELPQDHWIRFRIGINLGDVIVEPDDIYGDGVNVAARLEQLAEPGSIYISGGVYEQIRYKLVCGYQSLGDRKVKNILDPVPIYRVLPDPAAVAKVATRRWLRMGALTAAGLAVIMGAGGWYLWQRQPEQVVIFERPTQATLQSAVQTIPLGPRRADDLLPIPKTPTEAPAPVLPPPSTGPAVQAMLVPKLPSEPRVTEPNTIGIVGGSFEMGSNDDSSEQPLHRVQINPFLISRDVVTVGQWRECVQANVCLYVPPGNDDAPLGNVSWNDTQQYLKWLNSVTHRQWRLPTEAEWEYAARGGTKTRFWWGDAMKPGLAFCKGCGDAKAMKVGTVPANPYGLHINDGVSEWVEDCWVKDYRGAPANGAARVMPDCRERVIRGASSSNDVSYTRPASRDFYDASVRYPTHGFRVATMP